MYAFSISTQEKEYPEQLEQIKFLKEEIELLAKEHEKVLEELSEVANRERVIYQSKAQDVLDNVKSKFADVSISFHLANWIIITPVSRTKDVKWKFF